MSEFVYVLIDGLKASSTVVVCHKVHVAFASIARKAVVANLSNCVAIYYHLGEKAVCRFELSDLMRFMQGLLLS